MRSKKEKELLLALEAAACARGFDLVDIERAGTGGGTLLRVYIDKAGGLTLDDVAGANTWISATIETLDPFAGRYTLEVSSPGIDRPLRTFAHFVAAVGEELVVTLNGDPAASHATSHVGATPVSTPTTRPESTEQLALNKSRRTYTGTLVGVSEDEQLIELKAEESVYRLPLEHIKKARVKGHLDFESRKDS